MNLKPESSVLLDSLISQLKEILLASPMSDGSSIIEFLDKFDVQNALKISIDISVPQKIQEAQARIAANQFLSAGLCWYWDDDIGAFVQRPCP
jgi:hypothetical protein